MGWFWSSIESVVDKVSDIADIVIDTASDIKDDFIDTASGIADDVSDIASDVSDHIGNMGSKTWNSVTGRDDFEEAEELYEKMEKKYNNAKLEYENNISRIANEIESKVSNINYHKTNIFNSLFPKFVLLGNKIHNISIHGNNFLEYFDSSIIKINKLSGLTEKKKLYKIDFNSLKMKEVTYGIFTLGAYTRKKAKETLNNVKDQETPLNEIIEKMEDQVTKAEVVLESIDNVDEYFVVLIQNYSKLLERFEYGINSQIQKNILKGNKLEDGKLNFKLMPIVHIEEFQALFNLSIVLKQMASLGYLTELGEIKKDDDEMFKNVKTLVNNNCLAA